ncbi:hypothetical protein SCHPADRAFT_901601 [Schizopora paradoxa]|uniref:General negative regulator of transcription subunit n=1 Tax=Schizopora paradoxa TaxID=27342 RepID=A0A0H2RXM5_9AGAM|nr:hypothetical protein SCHPADRAFT_901601 [Schizopora paradoxa]
MAARKLQGEIDRTLKKVTEGVELFESIYDKMQASTNQTQKEKLETDLKTQIKKLQRMRDQIKTWVASNDIKDKSQLLEYRKLIETQMEKFKACEKEMKTKAFSKEGLTQASKLDPKAQEKLETTQWLQSRVEELTLQIEQSEAEIESLQGGPKKKKQGANTRLEDLEHLNERRKWHVGRLEIVLRLLENGSLSVEKVNGLKDDVSYFVDSNTEDNFDEDEGIYDELDLDSYGLVADDAEDDEDSDSGSEDLPPKTPSKKQEDDSPTNHKREEHSPILKKIGATLASRKTTTEAPKPPPNPNFASAPMASIVKNGLPPKPPAALPVRYATAAAAAVNATSSATASSAAATATLTTSVSGTSNTSHPTPAVPPISSTSNGTVASLSSMSMSTTQSSQDQLSAVTSSPSLTHPSVSAPSPMLSSAASVSGHAADDSIASTSQSPAISEAVPSSIAASHAMSSPELVKAQTAASISPEVEAKPLPASGAPAPASQEAAPPDASQSQSQQTASTSTTQPSLQLPAQVNIASSSASSPLPPVQPPSFPPGVLKVPQGLDQAPSPAGLTPQGLAPAQPQQSFGAQPQPQQQRGPGSLSDLFTSFEDVKQKAPHRMANLDQVHKLLEGSYSGMPQPQDTEKPKYYVPRTPCQTPTYYPQVPNPVLSSPALFGQLDVETLFYVFYFLPGTYQQYLAAKELKRQSWRFHVKYLTWFQRHSEPQAITEEYEQGVYVYFDWEGQWCQRKKADFRFEYRYLSED